MARACLPHVIELFHEAWIEGETIQSSEHQVILAHLTMPIARDCDVAQQ